MSDQNQVWQDEQYRVNDVVDEIKRKQTKLNENAGGLKEGIIDLRKNFWDDVRVNLDEPDDVIETQASMKQQVEVLSERERSYGRLHDQMKTLDRLQDSPYFGRIDFLEGDESTSEPIYVGIASLMDKTEEDFLIYDWRAPISSMYYDYAPGPAQYNTLDGAIQGEITLKRQFIIRKGQVTGLFDTGVTIGDYMLQEVLGNRANTKMKSIVATIQKEQNRIIRNEKSDLLIVQGVAGSGKTSAALQRVAYLLYAHRDTLSASNMMLFSPNPLFNSYVATVLPELGEENMQQTTYKEYAEARIGRRFQLEDSFAQMETLLTETDEHNGRAESILFKAQLACKQLLDTYVADLASHGLIFKSIRFRDRSLFSSKTIKQYFYELDSSISIPNRLTLVTERLLAELREIERTEWQEAWVENEVELLDKEDYLEAFRKVQKNKKWDDETFNDFGREQEVLGRSIVKKHFLPIKKRIKKFSFVDVKATYLQFYDAWTREKNGELQLPSSWNQICDWTIENLNQNRFSWDDVTPYLYFQDRIKGRASYTHIRHVLIDEVQDYSPFQLTYLKELFAHAKITLLGDVNQAIYAHASVSPSILSQTNSENETRISLMRSYRSTRQIVEFTKQFVEGGEHIEPFNREGELPILAYVNDQKTLYKKMSSKMNELQAKGHETIAVICKTMQESKEAYKQLQPHGVAVQLMDQQTYTFHKGILVIPTYLAKGIEFDAVIVHDASRTKYSKESERKLFYTACTRAMHELHLYSAGEVSPFVQQVSSELYTIDKV
ncbi:RNA polymerase recycling motor HelD [Bacillus fonticola]|uniref:RNA polymerase recycling motor HelD n=1 Tax=Bacillus fonticola TaxID=2728853 RepID=UPI001473DF48|nr:RNA polymerase recycling motor HelD [Bacillus fonticola]